MKKQTLHPIKIFILSGLFSSVCIAGLLAIDTRIGSQEFLMQLTYGSKKELLIQLLESGLRIFALLFISTFVTQALYTLNRMFGRLMVIGSLALAYYLFQYNPTLIAVFYLCWFFNLLFIRGVRL